MRYGFGRNPDDGREHLRDSRLSVRNSRRSRIGMPAASAVEMERSTRLRRPRTFRQENIWADPVDPAVVHSTLKVRRKNMAKANRAVPEGYHTLTPQLTMDNAAAAIDWYKKALGAQELSRAVGPDGKIMHAALRIGNSIFMLNDEMGGGRSAKTIGGSPMSLWIYVDDCDALFNRAVAAGAQVPPGPMGQLMDQFWGDRTGTIKDPHGFTWTIATRKEDLTDQEIKVRMDEFMRAYAAQHK
jgi:PhnB protein